MVPTRDTWMGSPSANAPPPRDAHHRQQRECDSNQARTTRRFGVRQDNWTRSRHDGPFEWVTLWPDRTLEVIGRGAVTIIDGSEVQTDAFRTKGHRPMMVSGAILHSLPAGYRFDLDTRTLLPMAEEAVPRRAVAEAESAKRRMQRLARRIAAEGANSFTVERDRSRAKEDKEASE